MGTCHWHYESGGKCNESAPKHQSSQEHGGELCNRHWSVYQAERAAPPPDPVHHPAHYKQGGIEVIDCIEAWQLGFCLGNTVKYVARAGKKDASKRLEDLKKARWYLDREIQRSEA